MNVKSCSLLAYYVVLVFGKGLAKSAYPEQRIFEYIFKDYYKFARPAPTTDTITNVSISLSLISLNNYDPEGRVLTSMTWISMDWEDHRLAWHGYAEMFDWVKSIHVPPSDIWTPDIVLSNSIESFSPQFPPRLEALVQDDGKVLLVIPSLLKTQCVATNTTTVVRCPFSFVPWTYNELELMLSLGNIAVILSDYTPRPGIEIIRSTAEVKKRRYDCCAEPFYDVLFSIDIKLGNLVSSENV